MKKKLYVALFTFLGILLSYIAHAVIEISAIILLADGRRSFALPWETWMRIHGIGSVLLLVLGIWFGYTQGKKWWRIIYVEKRFRKEVERQ